MQILSSTKKKTRNWDQDSGLSRISKLELRNAKIDNSKYWLLHIPLISKQYWKNARKLTSTQCSPTGAVGPQLNGRTLELNTLKWNVPCARGSWSLITDQRSRAYTQIISLRHFWSVQFCFFACTLNTYAPVYCVLCIEQYDVGWLFTLIREICALKFWAWGLAFVNLFATGFVAFLGYWMPGICQMIHTSAYLYNLLRRQFVSSNLIC